MATHIVFSDDREEVAMAVRRDRPNPVKLEGTESRRRLHQPNAGRD
jgi:hypothetical protein